MNESANTGKEMDGSSPYVLMFGQISAGQITKCT